MSLRMRILSLPWCVNKHISTYLRLLDILGDRLVEMQIVQVMCVNCCRQELLLFLILLTSCNGKWPSRHSFDCKLYKNDTETMLAALKPACLTNEQNVHLEIKTKSECPVATLPPSPFVNISIQFLSNPT